MPGTPISITASIEAIQQYRERLDLPSHACHISLADLKGIQDFAEQQRLPLNGIRCYYAKSAEDEFKLRLLIVGTTLVEDVDTDIIDPATGDGVFDLTTPCPEFCDLNSPLMTLSFEESK
jgi:hypothetical protein